MFKVNNENIRTTSMTSFWYFQCSGVSVGFFSSVSFLDFEQLNVSWEPIQSICNTGQFTNFYAIKLFKTCIKFIFIHIFPNHNDSESNFKNTFSRITIFRRQPPLCYVFNIALTKKVTLRMHFSELHYFEDSHLCVTFLTVKVTSGIQHSFTYNQILGYDTM